MENISEIKKPPRRDLVYFRQNQRNEVFQSVVAHFAKVAGEDGLTKKELAEMLGKDPAQITRWFSGPKNWELDTISDLLLAMKARMVHTIVPLSDHVEQSNTVVIEKTDSAEITATGSRAERTQFVELEQANG